MPCLLDVKIGHLPEAELDGNMEWSEVKRASLQTKGSSETENVTVNVCPLLVKSSHTSMIEVTTPEKSRLRRVANSFSVQVSAKQFFHNPVKSLFSSFANVADADDVQDHFVAGYSEQPEVEEEDSDDLGVNDIDMVYHNESDDEIMAARMLT
jgi:hypothetical protein